MQENHYKLILIVALLACVLPAFMSFDVYQTIKKSDLAYNMPGATENTYRNCVLDMNTHMSAMHAYSLVNIVAYGLLLLMIVYMANRVLFAERELDSQRKKLQDLEVK